MAILLWLLLLLLWLLVHDADVGDIEGKRWWASDDLSHLLWRRVINAVTEDGGGRVVLQQ